MAGNRLSRALFFWPGALLIQFAQWLLVLSETRGGRCTLRPLFRVFCRFALYARPYVVDGRRTNDVVTPLQLDELIGRQRLIAAIPCACRAGRPACKIPHHGDHDPDVCLSFGLAAVVQIGSGLGKRLSPDQARDLCRRGSQSGLIHHAIYSFGSLFEVCNCCAATCSVVRAYRAGVREAVRPSPVRAVRGPQCDGCRDRDSRVCEEVCPYGLHPSSPDCLGCGYCVEQCPRGAVGMVLREPAVKQDAVSLPGRFVIAAKRGFQFSLRDLMILIAAVACVFGGFSIYGVTGVSVVMLVLGCCFIRRGDLASQPWMFSSGVALTGFSIVVLLLLLAGWLFLGIGPILPRNAWPCELWRMAKIAGGGTADVRAAQSGRGLLDHEYAWRLSIAPDKLGTIIAEYGMTSVRTEDVPAAFRRQFPPWWRPWHRRGNRYLSTPDFPGDSRGPDGYHFLAMYDRDRERLYVWHKDNF
ncbi:MAG: hypothetical protein GXX96_30025 [Planctomycetaceae bacterium]|nr:hypothetical protein [Planctomycetaceae bacterium]